MTNRNLQLAKAATWVRVCPEVAAPLGREKGGRHGRMPRNLRSEDIKRSCFTSMVHRTEKMEGQMDGHFDCCRYRPSLDDLLADEVMQPVLRSAGLDQHELREMMVETARRIDDRDRRGPAGEADE